jgi:hypothetical protein
MRKKKRKSQQVENPSGKKRKSPGRMAHTHSNLDQLFRTVKPDNPSGLSL